MRQVTAGDANRRFSEILSVVETGDEVTITKDGRPVAIPSPYHSPAHTAERQATIDRAIAVTDDRAMRCTNARDSYAQTLLIDRIRERCLDGSNRQPPLVIASGAKQSCAPMSRPIEIPTSPDRSPQ